MNYKISTAVNILERLKYLGFFRLQNLTPRRDDRLNQLASFLKDLPVDLKKGFKSSTTGSDTKNFIGAIGKRWSDTREYFRALCEASENSTE